MPRQRYIADLKKAGEGLSIAGNVSPPNMLARSLSRQPVSYYELSEHPLTYGRHFLCQQRRQ